MNAIPFIRRTANERVDGTLTVKIDIEPMYKLQFLQMFPDIGTEGALARLEKTAAVTPQPESPKEKGKVGPLCIMACTFCADLSFQFWLASKGYFCENEETAKQRILEICGITSRKDLDADSHAARRFHDNIRSPFLDWKDGNV